MEALALDKNIAIELLNGNPETVNLIQRIDAVYLPVTVCGELLFGAANSAKSSQNLVRFKKFISACFILYSSILVAEEYARIRKDLKEMVKPIPENDIWIAAICIVNGIGLATRDKHFENVPELKVFNFS